MRFDEELASRASVVNAWLEEYLRSEEGYAKNTIEAANYSVRAGGKRLRPIILTETHKLFSDVIMPSVKPLAVALEMIHTYSLVHDDLPAMDNDLLRRGMPTTHAKFGEAVAILAGDALLNGSMETALCALDVSKEQQDPDYMNRIVRSVRCLYDKAGINGMIGGQNADIMAERRASDITLEEIEYIYAKKTAALIEASMMIGCILALESTDEDVLSMEQAASKIGLAFQIQDDILDVEGDEAVIGKPVGSDLRNNKTTYIDHVGIDQAKRDVKSFTEEAVSIVQGYTGSDDFLVRLLISLIDRKK